MSLTLTTLRCPETVPPQTRQVTGADLSIGRGVDNDWVLPDPERHLSKRHCTLSYRDGAWLVADTSTNGTFINFDDIPLGQIGPRSLRDGDRLRLGLYELEVRIVAEQPRRPPPREPDPTDDATRVFRPATDRRPPPPTHAPIQTPVHAPHDEPDEAVIETMISDGPFAEPLLDRHGAPTSSLPPGTPPPATGDLLAAFLRGAGMPGGVAPADPEAAMQALGAAFRTLVSGLRKVLLARASIKSEFRIEQTMIRARGNNPLKFAVGDEAALAAMLGLGHRTDMPAADAIRDALRDMQLHELAVMAAMQSAVRALVAQFDPEAIRAGTDQGGLALVAAQRKARAWEAFEALHARTTQALADDFDSVFGKAFAIAYEQTLEEAATRTETL